MPRYFIQLAYNGKAFHGWQVQPNALTVQGEINRALGILCKEEVNIVGAGRTDTGVHASFFVAHFDLQKSLDNCDKLCYKLNRFLPDEIDIQLLFPVADEAHARFDALSRTYRYCISNKKEPFRKEFTAFVPQKLNIDAMNVAAKALFNYSDFTSFSKLHTDVKTNICKIGEARWFEKNGLLVFEIKADRFLRNMVRAIVGTLIEVGKGMTTVEEFKNIIEGKDRSLAGASAKAEGLFLCDIAYPELIEKKLIKDGDDF